MLHFATYSGFDRTRLRPAVVVEDTLSSHFIALYPGSRSAIEECRKIGVQEYHKPGKGEQFASPNGGKLDTVEVQEHKDEPAHGKHLSSWRDV
jgi:hypothetical protein